MKKLFLAFLATFAMLFSQQVTAQGLEPSAMTIYRIENLSNGKYLSNGDNMNNDARIVFADANASSAGQEWALYPTEMQDVVILVNPTSGKALDMAPGVGNPVQWNYEPANPNQHFKMIEVGSDVYKLANSSNPYQYLAAASNGYPMMSSSYSGNAIQYRFHDTGKRLALPPTPGKTFVISNVANKEVITAPEGSGLADYAYSKPYVEGDEGQMWKITSGKNGLVFTVHSCDLSLDMFLNGDKTPLLYTKDADNYNQNVFTEEVGDGTYRLYGIYQNTKYYIKSVAGQQLVATADKGGDETKFFFTEVAAPLGDYWENQQIFEENKEAAHATFIPYASTAAMKEDVNYAFPWLTPEKADYLSLNGTWKFNWVKQPSERPADFYETSYDVSGWDDIDVPSCWESKGYGNHI